MRRLLWLLIAACLSAGSANADDGWQTALSFPLVSNKTAAGRAGTFTDPNDGFTYAYFGANTASGAQVWRSSDGVTWTQVNVNGFGSQGGQPLLSGVSWFSTFAEGGGPTYLYVGVTPDNSLDDGIAIYRSSGGVSTSQWSLVLSSVTLGSHVAVDPGGPGVSFNNALYFGTNNPVSGTHVWKSTSADGLSSWFAVAGGGFGEGAAANPQTSYLKAFGGELYAATGCDDNGAACGQIWKSTGTVFSTDTDTWTQVLAATNTFDANTGAITALESFGGQLYAATLNTAGRAQVWRTATPDTGGWAVVKTPDSGCATCFSVAGSTAVIALRAVSSYLYAGTWDSGVGLIVYRSADGSTWTRSNAAAGFGTTNNQSMGDFAQLGTTVIGDSYNPVSGGALWKALLPGAAGAPGQPSVASVSQTSITWTWSAAAGALSYDVYEASSPSTLLANVASATYPEVGLSTDTQYGIVVTAVTGAGQSILSPAGYAYTLAAPPTGLSVSQVFSSSFTVSWAADTNPAGTTYRVEYWLENGATTTVVTTNVSLTLMGLLDGDTYFTTVTAVDGSGVSTPSGVVLSTLTVSVPSLAAQIGPGGGTILFNTPSGIAEVVIPANAFTQTVTITVSTTIAADFPTALAPASQQLTPTGVGLQFNVNPAVEPSRTVTVLVPFTAPEMLGFNVNDLQLARYDSLENVWVPLAGSVSAANGQVTAVTDHLSLFQLMQASAGGSISSAKAFPNPLRPALGETYMTFSMLPAGARVRIYTLTGVLVKDLTADATGTANWDATNDAGSSVASGVYFVFAQEGGQHRTFKVAVQR